MPGNVPFFSPVQVPHRNAKTRPPWRKAAEDLNNDDPNGQTSSSSRPLRPELASCSFSSSGSSLGSNNPENHLVRRRAKAEVPKQPPVAEHSYLQDARGRDGRESLMKGSSYSARICRICACLAILALLGIVLMIRLVLHSTGDATLTKVKPTNGSPPIIHRGMAAPPIDLSPPPPPPVDRSPPGPAPVNRSPPPPPSSPPVTDEEPPISAAERASLAKAKRETLRVEEAASRPMVTPRAAQEPIIQIPTAPKEPQSPQGPAQESRPVVKDRSKEACWIFMHMEKSGGATVRNIATEHWRRDELMFDNVQWRRGDGYALDIMTRSHWRLLHGGCVEALRRHKGRTCKWFTVFRHPVARLLSAFYHCRDAPQDPLCSSAATTDLVTFAEHWGNFGLRQFSMATVSPNAVKEWAAGTMPRGLSVWLLLEEYLRRNGVAKDAVLEGMLEPVQELLRTQYAAVGIASQLNTTMLLFDKALSMPELDWSAALERRKAVDVHDKEYDDPGQTALAEALANPRIVSALRLDIILYESAVKVFHEQVARYGIE